MADEQTGAQGDGADTHTQQPGAGPDDAAIQAIVEREREAFARQLKELTGHESFEAAAKAKADAEAAKLAEQGKFEEMAQAAAKERDEIRARYEAAQVSAAIMGAASGSVDPATVHALLAGQAKVLADGSVTVDGKPAADAVAALLAEKPYLAKPAAGEGSGAGSSGTAAGGKALDRAAFDALSADDKMAHIRAGGTVTEA